MLGPHTIKLSFMKLCKWTATSDLSHNSFQEINKIKTNISLSKFFRYLPELNIECEVRRIFQLLITNGNHKESIKYKQVLVHNGELLSEILKRNIPTGIYCLSLQPHCVFNYAEWRLKWSSQVNILEKNWLPSTLPLRARKMYDTH